MSSLGSGQMSEEQRWSEGRGLRGDVGSGGTPFRGGDTGETPHILVSRGLHILSREN